MRAALTQSRGVLEQSRYAPRAMSVRRTLSEEKMTETVREQQRRFFPTTVDAVIEAVESRPVVVVGMAQNPHVKKARKGLDAAGIEFTYLEYGNYLNNWRRRLSIKMWSGYPTFPQVFVRGTLIGGNRELQEMLASGELRRMLDASE